MASEDAHPGPVGFYHSAERNPFYTIRKFCDEESLPFIDKISRILTETTLRE